VYLTSAFERSKIEYWLLAQHEFGKLKVREELLDCSGLKQERLNSMVNDGELLKTQKYSSND
jgi:hypothetical protein